MLHDNIGGIKMKIKSISIFGMHNAIGSPRTYTFKDINYIIGANGAGKSTILQAIQLAILGYLPGTDKRVSEIFTHCSSRTMTLDLRLTDDEHVTNESSESARIVRAWTRKGTKIESTSSITPEGFDITSAVSEIELPIFNFTEFLNLSRNKLKSWFLNFLPEPDCKIDWKQEFEMALLSAGHILADQSYLQEVLDECAEGDSGLSSVQATNENLKELLSAKKLEVARLEGAVQALIFYDDLQADDYDAARAEILGEISKIKQLRDEASRVKNALESNSKTIAYIENAEKELLSPSQLEPYEATIAEYDSQKVQTSIIQKEENTNDQIRDIRVRKITIQADIEDRQKILKGKGVCPYTQKKCESVSELIEIISPEIEDLKIELADLNLRESELLNQIESLKQQRFKLDADYGVAKQNVDYNKLLETQIADMKTQLIPISQTEIYASLNPIESFDTKEQQLQDELAKIEANRVYEQRINEITANKFKAENELEALKVLIKRTDANNMQTEIAQLPFNDFVKDMNTIIPDIFGDDTKFKVNLESKANSFSFGIMKDSSIGELYIPYDLMSSGEKTMLAFALMMYIIKHSSSCFKFLLVDDMLDHLDDENFAQLFGTFSKSGIQIVTAGVKAVCIPNMHIINIGGVM